MAYTLYYTANSHNRKNQLVEISIFKLDGDVVDVENFPVTRFDIIDNGEDETKYNPIAIRQIELGLWIEQGSPVTWESFIASDYTDWKITCTIDSQPYFEGFIVPDQGEGPFKDQPYEITIRATNGLALLKEIPLVDVNGDEFTSDNVLIAYIAGALKKTGLDLPIRVYCNYLYVSMLNKGDGLEYDMFNQASLDSRTFKKDPKTFVSCYDALLKILNKFCVLEYWNGYWQITCLADRQYVQGDWFYVDYDSNGENPSGVQVTENHAQVGKSVDIFPVNANQTIGCNYAVRSVKSLYNYQIFPSLYNNEGLGELGANIPSLSGPGYNAYQLVGWVHKKQFLDEVDAVTNAYIKTEVDAYFKEKSRYYVVERDASAPVDSSILNYIRPSNRDFYVTAGDKIDVSITGRLNADIATIWGACSILIFTGGDITDAANYWRLNPFGQFDNFAPTALGWAQFSGSDLDLSEWQTESLNEVVIPVDGILTVLLNDGFSGATEAHFKDLRITYNIFVGGSYFSSKGDYWLRSQNKTFPNVTEDEILISDSPRRIARGALLFINESVNGLTSPDWYRFYQIGDPNPTSEQKDFKQLLNIGRYNDQYRRFYKIEGDFDGLNFAPENDQLNKQPIGFHKKYRFVDMSPQRDFVLVPPLKMNIAAGTITATFQEVFKDDEDGTQEGDSEIFDYIFSS